MVLVVEVLVVVIEIVVRTHSTSSYKNSSQRKFS